jgi:prepilin-type N-terminal cleavage/methylation domain-containing protein
MVNQRGFTLPELLIVVTIIMLVLLYEFPAYKTFSAKTELKNASTVIRDELRVAQNKALNGKVPSSGITSFWVFHIHTQQSGTSNHYETAGCNPLNNIFASAECSDVSISDFKQTVLPDKFHIYPVAISPEPADKYDTIQETNLFFAPISGAVKVYDDTGTLLGTSINIKIQSDEYPDIYYLFTVNSNGTISEQTL